MLELTVCDDLQTSLNSVSYKDTLVVVGEEESGTLIYSWNSPNSDSAEIVTHIGTYNRQTKLKKEVYVFDRCIRVVNATISPEESFLAFVTWEQNPPGIQGIYAAYIAEIRPANNLYSLSLDSPFYILLRFIYSVESSVFFNPAERQPSLGFNLVNDNHLIVVRHTESVGIYHISAAFVENDGLILSSEPKKEQVLHRGIVWAKWDAAFLCLYVLQQQHRKKDALPEPDVLPLLTAYQFYENGTYKEIMHIIIDLPLSFSRTRLKYLEISPCNYVPVSNLNFQVLQHSNGTICVCYQHGAVASSRRSYVHKSSDVRKQFTWYTVVLPHCGKLLEAKSSWALPSTALITFAWLGERLLVHFPGRFSHLLNVGTHTDHVHHIIWEDECSVRERCDSLPTETDCQTENKSCQNHTFLTLSSLESSGMELYDSHLKCIFRVSVSEDALLKMFRETDDIQTRLAVLHYAVSSGLEIVTQLFEVMRVCRFFFTDLCALLAEYLVSLTYVLFRRQAADADVLLLIPFTSLKSLSARIVHSKTYSYEPVWNQETKEVRGQGQGQGHQHPAFLPTEHRLSQSRFNLLAVKQALLSDDSFVVNSTDDNWVEVESEGESGSMPRFASESDPSVLLAESSIDRSSDSFASGAVFKAELSHDPVPPFFLGSSHAEITNVEEDRHMFQTSKLLQEHIRNRSRLLSPAKIRRLAHEYTRCQLRSSRRLLQIVWNISKGEADDLSEDESDAQEHNLLCLPPTVSDFQLLKFLECFTLVTSRLSFPHPRFFSGFLSSLVFRCRSRGDFLRHLDHGVVHVDLSFCIRVIRELDDSEENVKLKMQLLRHLKQDDILTCYRVWGHPLAMQLLTQHFAANCMTGSEIPVGENLSQNSFDQSLLPPVALFLQLLEERGFRDVRHMKAIKGNKAASRHVSSVTENTEEEGTQSSNA